MKLGRWLARAVMGHPKRSIAAMVVLTASLAAFGTKPTIDNRLGRLLDEDHPVRQASQRVDRELSGILSIEIEFVAPAPWSASQWQDALSPFEAWARDQPRVGAVLGPSLPAPIRDAVPIVASTRQHARVSLRVPDIGGRAFSELRVQVERAATQTGLPATLTGTTAVAYEGVDRITRELFVSLTTAMVLVAAILVALIRKPAIAAVALIVNAVPLALATWLMGRLAPQQDPVSTVILTLAIGIAVDDTIHLLERYREQRATGDSPRRAAATALQRGGVPVLITSLVLAVGLAINLGSSFPALALLGALGTSVILLATAFDIVLLPVLVSWVDGVRTDATGADTDRR
jgi:hypothetical protein